MKHNISRLLTKLILFLSIVAIAGMASCTGLTEEKATAFIDNAKTFANENKDKVADSEILKDIDSAINELNQPHRPNETAEPNIIDKIKDEVNDSYNTETPDYATRFNSYRQSKGLQPLIFTDDLNQIAQLRLVELKSNFRHASRGGYNNHLAENIAMRTGSLSNQGALSMWQNSPGHNANMLGEDYKYTGYACGGGYAIQLFTSYQTINGEPQVPPGWYWNN